MALVGVSAQCNFPHIISIESIRCQLFSLYLVSFHRNINWMPCAGRSVVKHVIKIYAEITGCKRAIRRPEHFSASLPIWMDFIVKTKRCAVISCAYNAWIMPNNHEIQIAIQFIHIVCFETKCWNWNVAPSFWRFNWCRISNNNQKVRLNCW